VSTHRKRAALALTSILLLAIAPAALATGADTITVREQHVDFNPGETNPCTGVTGTIVDDEQDVFHITELTDGSLHLTGHGTVSVTFTPDDPDQATYAGHETFALSESSSDRTFTTTTTTHLRVKGTDGSFLAIREVAHFTVSPNAVIVSFDKATLRCS
jgi:hypothetical protein